MWALLGLTDVGEGWEQQRVLAERSPETLTVACLLWKPDKGVRKEKGQGLATGAPADSVCA